jgi:hypothetical protein
MKRKIKIKNSDLNNLVFEAIKKTLDEVHVDEQTEQNDIDYLWDKSSLLRIPQYVIDAIKNGEVEKLTKPH